MTLTTEQLEEIRERAEHHLAYVRDSDRHIGESAWLICTAPILKDIPALLSHIEALTTERDALKRVADAGQNWWLVRHRFGSEHPRSIKTGRELTSALVHLEQAIIALKDAGYTGESDDTGRD